jgi:hypothetical protein
MEPNSHERTELQTPRESEIPLMLAVIVLILHDLIRERSAAADEAGGRRILDAAEKQPKVTAADEQDYLFPPARFY